MDIDAKFIRELKLAVKPENLINDEMWSSWNDILNNTAVYDKKVIAVARLKKMRWPPTRSDDTFGSFLSMELSKVLSMLGWDAKRALLICLAEEYITCVQNTNKSNENSKYDENIAAVSCNKTTDIVVNQDYNIYDEINELCNKARNGLTKIISNNIENNDLMTEVNDIIFSMCGNISNMSESKRKNEQNMYDVKQLLDEMVEMSQNQIIDIDELSKENKRLMSEIDTYKSKYFELKSSYDKLKLSNYGFNNFKSNAIDTNIVTNCNSFAINNPKESSHSTAVVAIPKLDPPEDRTQLQPSVTDNSIDDVKI